MVCTLSLLRASGLSEVLSLFSLSFWLVSLSLSFWLVGFLSTNFQDKLTRLKNFIDGSRNIRALQKSCYQSHTQKTNDYVCLIFMCGQL